MESASRLEQQPPISYIPETFKPLFADTDTARWAATAPPGHIHDYLARKGLSFSSEDSVEETFSRIGEIMKACSIETPEWQQTQRDVALNLIDMTLASSLATPSTAQQTDLVEAYANTVRTLDPNMDYLGAPHSMYEVGVCLASYITASDQATAYRARMIVRAAWSAFYASKTDAADKEIAKASIEDVVSRFYVSASETNSWEWARDMPPMSPHQAEIHDHFITHTEGNRSFMPQLVRTTLEYQAAVLEEGQDPVDFWNLGDTTRIVPSLQTLHNSPGLAKSKAEFDALFKKSANLTTEDLLADEKLARALTDQINTTFEKVRTSTLQRAHDAQHIFTRLHAQVVQSTTARKPEKKLKPVRNYLQIVGLPANLPPAELNDLFEDADFQAQFTQHVEEHNAAIFNLDQELEALFPSRPYNNFTLGKRDRFDLYAADLTRDCTAYHLECGFNGWTVPLWLSTPSFEMAYLKEGDINLGKVGLLLGHDGTQPRLIIDSLEVFKDLPLRNEDAIFFIRQGLLQIQDWADKRGFGDVLFCTFTNSSELNAELPYMPNPSEPESLNVLQGIQGLNELFRSIPGEARYSRQDEVSSIGYLQASKAPREDNNEDDDIPALTEHDPVIQHIETSLATTRSEELFSAARNGNEDDVIMLYVKKALPTLHKLFGDNVQLFTTPLRDRKAIDYFSYIPDFFSDQPMPVGATANTVAHFSGSQHLFFAALISYIEGEDKMTASYLNNRGDAANVQDFTQRYRQDFFDESYLPRLTYKESVNRQDYLQERAIVQTVEPLDTASGRNRLISEAARLDGLLSLILSAQQRYRFSDILRFIFAGDAEVGQGNKLSTKLQIIQRESMR